MKAVSLVVALWIASVPSIVQAANIGGGREDGKTFVRQCKSAIAMLDLDSKPKGPRPKDLLAARLEGDSCVYFTQGVVSALAFVARSKGGASALGDFSVCFPSAGADPVAIIRKVVELAESSPPSFRNELGSTGLVVLATHAVYGCPLK